MNEVEMNLAADYLDLSAEIVTSYVSNNSVPPNEIGNLITTVHLAIKTLAEGGSISPKEIKAQKLSLIQIKKSITPNGIISFEDGKSYKTMRRHLTSSGLTPEGYRAKWGLPVDYPIIAPNYSAARSALARSFGLGQLRKGSAKPAQAEAVETKETVAETPGIAKAKRAGRPRKAVAAE